ncbi:MAG: hypothetical protein KA260_04945 [Burkholderiales bacterium]|nr:hypothetical protein [Burkholderiales bacterium]
MVTFSRDRWIHDVQSNTFRREALPITIRGRTFGADITAPLSYSPQLQRLRQVIAENSAFSRHADSLIGTWAGQSSFPANDLYCFTIRRALDRGEFLFDERRFTQDYKLLERQILAETLLWRQTTAVKGATLPLTQPVQLTPTLCLRRLGIDEVQDYLGKGLRLGHGSMGDEAGLIFQASDIVLERQLPFPKLSGDALDPAGAQKLEAMLSLEEEELFIALMRVVADGLVMLGDQLRNEAEPVFFIGCRVVRRSNPAIPGGISYQLERPVLDELLCLWAKLYPQTRSRKFLVRAIRRFSSSLYRESFEDRVIDLAIAGESLFLSGDGENTELTFRLSHRAGAYLGESAQTKLDIYRIFKTFYSLRSKIVHGASDPLRSDSDLRRHQATVASVTTHMREALKRAICGEPRPGTDTGLVAAWDELLFDSIRRT